LDVLLRFLRGNFKFFEILEKIYEGMTQNFLKMFKRFSSNPHNLKPISLNLLAHLPRKHSPLARQSRRKKFLSLKTKPTHVAEAEDRRNFEISLFSRRFFRKKEEIVSSVNTHTDSFRGPISLARSCWSRSSSPSDRSGAFSLLVTNAIVENFLHRTTFS
jgi:hypothetical protein